MNEKTGKKRLSDILASIEEYNMLSGRADAVVESLSYDSRECSSGGLFFCIRGFNVDGHDFIPEAVARGAKIIVVEREVKVPAGCVVVRVQNTRRAMGIVSSAFFDHPSKELNILGVTGTNGKTSVSLLAEALLRSLGKRTGLIGTVENRIVDEVLPVKRTTPESLDLQMLLARMVEAGCTDVSMEVSSHAVELHRISGCTFTAGVFTNLTQDHLDFHGDFNSYCDVKKRFFEQYLVGNATQAIVNADDTCCPRIVDGLSCGVIRFGIDNEEAEVKASDVRCGGRGIEYKVIIEGQEVGLINCGLLGRFNVYNTLAVVAYAHAHDIPFDSVRRILRDITPVPGRFERVTEGQNFTVVVDYAHTPDGLENILRSAGEIADGRVIAVFGAGGDRDRTKRPIMGGIAVRLSDHAVVTSDNPRSEAPSTIIEDILEGVEAEKQKKPGMSWTVEADRFEAIRKAISMARAGDVVVIAGKGHETYQIFKDRTIHFDDREVARNILVETRDGTGSDR